MATTKHRNLTLDNTRGEQRTQELSKTHNTPNIIYQHNREQKYTEYADTENIQKSIRQQK